MPQSHLRRDAVSHGTPASSNLYGQYEHKGSSAGVRTVEEMGACRKSLDGRRRGIVFKKE